MAGRAMLLAAALLLLLVERARASCSNSSYVSGQLELMLAEYERAQPPPGPVRVAAALDVQHATVDDGAATVRLLATMHLRWEDKRLSWNASSWGCHVTATSSERLWLPDVNALNAVTRGNAAGVGLRARLFSEGRVSWMLRFDLTSPISLDLQAWPRDVQQVTFKFGSRHHGAMFNLSVEDLSHGTVFESGTWELVKVTSLGTSTWRGGDVAAWRVTLRRRAAAHALAAGGVLAAAALLLVGAALQPPGSRPALAATAAFIASIWRKKVWSWTGKQHQRCVSLLQAGVGGGAAAGRGRGAAVRGADGRAVRGGCAGGRGRGAGGARGRRQSAAARRAALARHRRLRALQPRAAARQHGGVERLGGGRAAAGPSAAGCSALHGVRHRLPLPRHPLASNV